MSLRIDGIMQNGFLLSDSSEEYETPHRQKRRDMKKKSKLQISSLKGGGDVKDVIPSAGFPPIFSCATKPKKRVTDSKDRAYSKNDTSVSLGEIIGKRQSVTPFI